MKEIKITYSKNTGFDAFFDNIKSIMVEPTGMGGNFGDIYAAKSFIGKNNPPHQQVIKIFKPDNGPKEAHSWNTINRLQEEVILRVKEFKENNASDFFNEFPALLALPQMVFEGVMEGQRVRGASYNDLKKLDLVPFDEIIDEEGSPYFDEYWEKDLEWKLTTAYHLVRGFNFLKSAHFIHADISSDNIFVGLDKPIGVILDYDSGAVVQSLDDNPSTFGKFQPWLAPEISFQLKKNTANGNSLVNLTEFTDRWSVAHAIFNLLLMMDAFFLKEMSETNLKEYQKKYKWPHIDTRDVLFIDELTEETYEIFLNNYESLPEEIRRKFEYTFTKGVFDPKSRTSYYQWEQVLKNLIPAKERKSSSSTFQNNSLSNISSFVEVQPMKTASSQNSSVKQKELSDFVNALVVDLVAGKKRTYKTKLTEMANAAGKNGKELVEDIENFVLEFKDSIEDGVITKMEKATLITQGKFALVTKETIEKMLEPYEAQKTTIPVVTKEEPITPKKGQAQVTKKTIVATDDTIFDIVRNEIKRLGKKADLNHIDVSRCSSFFQSDEDDFDDSVGTGLFEDTGFCGDVSQWDVSNVKNMSCVFSNCNDFNADLSHWNVSKVEDMSGMFNNCKKFNQNLSTWNVSGVYNMESMFENCGCFEGIGLSNWDVRNLGNINSMFKGCKKLKDCDLSHWDISGFEDGIYWTEDAFKDCPLDQKYWPPFKPSRKPSKRKK